MKKTLLTIAAALALTGAAAAQSMTNGQVQKIDTEQGKVTLRHEAIKNLDMDSMTMVFRIQDPAMLKQVKVKDKVKFEADRVNGQLTVTKIQKAK